MNDLTGTTSTLQIVAVVYCNFVPANSSLKMKEEPYFYLDTIGLVNGEYGLVHNGNEYGIVRVVRVFNKDESVAVPFVKKPILAKVLYDHELIRDAAARLEEYADRTFELRVEERIDKILGKHTLTIDGSENLRRPKTKDYYAKHHLDVDEDEIPLD